MKRSLARFIFDDGGSTATEYALLAILASIMIVAGARSIGTKLSANYIGGVAANL